MNQTAKQLLQLQEKDEKIDHLRQIIDSVPDEQKRLHDTLADAEGQVEAAKTAAQQVQSQIDALETDVQACNQRIEELQNRSLQVKKNDEYRSILSAIDKEKEKISAAEDKELELMDKAEEAKAEHADKVKDRDAAVARIKSQEDDLAKRNENCQAQIEVIQKERDEIAKGIDQDIYRRYQRLRKQPNIHRPVAPVTKDACGNCYLQLTREVTNKAGADHDVSCGNCGAILYMRESDA